MTRANKFLSVAFVFMCLFVGADTVSAQSVNQPQLQGEVRTEFLRAWNGYKKYCWGHDDLKPLSKTCRDWYAGPLLMTPVDALDTICCSRRQRRLISIA